MRKSRHSCRTSRISALFGAIGLYRETRLLSLELKMVHSSAPRRDIWVWLEAIHGPCTANRPSCHGTTSALDLNRFWPPKHRHSLSATTIIKRFVVLRCTI